MTHEKSITLHQQDGGMSVQAFADLEGLTLRQARSCLRRGKVLGARQDARSKHWWLLKSKFIRLKKQFFSDFHSR